MSVRKFLQLTILTACITITSIAQNGPAVTDPYTVQWGKADSLLEQSLPEQARSIVQKIYTEASNKNLTVQVLKAQLYFMRINTANREDADSLNIAAAESKAASAPFPVNAVWKSIAAQLYWQYYQNNRYKILGRTHAQGADSSDFAQWDAAGFFEKTGALYLQSIERADALKGIPIDTYDPVLIMGENTRHLRPTLFDLLAFRAIAFFSNDEKDITRPAFSFVMEDAWPFAPAPQFISHVFANQDSASMQYRALTLYQEVLRLHAGDATPNAFIDADLQRIEFAYAHSINPNKKALYEIALNEIQRANGNNPLTATAAYRIAALMMEEDAVTVNDDEEFPTQVQKPMVNLRAVLARLDSIIAKYPASEGGIDAQHLRQNIMAPSMSLTAEEAVLPNTPSKVLVTYKNVPRAFFRVVRMDAEDYRTKMRGNNSDGIVQELLAAKPVQAFALALPGTDDYAQHAAEVKLDALPYGMYTVIISARESFAQEDNVVSYAVCQSTGLAVVIPQQHRAGQASGFILDRKTGTPVVGATVAFLTAQWNGNTRAYDYTRTGTITTETDGAFSVTAKNRSYNGLIVKRGDDEFYSPDYLNFYRYDEHVEAREHTFFFTDRSIYRPGQTIHFKGILVLTGKNDRQSNVVDGKKVTVTFYDANRQKIADQTLTTNAWGSISGTFTAPQSGLTGLMHIESESGSTYISVEEYKRPKFRVDWDTLKSDYALNESVIISGHALAYAGNNLDGATVKYRVVRQARFPYWWYAWRWGGGARSPQQEISQGTTTTDASGKFTIRFQTLPDPGIDERSLPVFTYIVYADVTDLNGETRSGTQRISAGYRSLQFSTDIPERASRKELDTVHMTTQNLNGTFVAANVSIKIARLDQPEVVYRNRIWAQPDQFTMGETDFRKNFPLDAYKDEDDYRKWEEAEILYEARVTTNASGNVPLPAKAFFRNSWYAITFSTKDKNGKAIEEKKFVQVWDEGAEDKPYAALFVVPNAQKAEPGARASVDAVTGMNEVHVIRKVQTMDEQVVTTQHDLAGSALTWNKQITEGDRGGIALSFLTVKDNRVYTQTAHIDVPWTNKDLSIEWATHRDKMLPGSEETWTMIVRGNKKDKVAAELAAALYDVSLDAFKPHGWGIPGLFPILSPQPDWQTHIGFGSADVRQIGYFSSPTIPSFDKSYDRLIFIDADLLEGSYSVKKRRSMYLMDVQSTRAKVPGANATIEATATRDEAAPIIDPENPGGKSTKTAEQIEVAAQPQAPETEIQIRKNLQETAFFYPQLQTDAEGAVRIKFTIPEALTEWKLLAFAHTKDMRSGYTTGTVKTQKDLMVQPGLPRFLRQGDEITLSTKIVNLSDVALSGTATLEILDALTGKSLNVSFSKPPNPSSTVASFAIDFSAPKGGSTSAAWTLHVPESRYEPVIIRIIARAGAFSDGEENVLPVLTNRMLVTETIPLWINGNGSKNFKMDKLLQSAQSNTTAQHRLTVEYTANPAWYALKALPYLMEYPYECAEQTFNRYYANALAAHVLDKAPRVKEIFRKWEMESMLSSFKSPLEQNEELKSALLEETPWVLDAQNESEQRKNIALLFQTEKLARDLDKSARQLEDLLLPEGGWPWFKGDRPSRYITQYIVTGIGRLQHLGIEQGRLTSLTEKALFYLDRNMETSYKELVNQKANLKEQHIGYMEVQYLYMRSFFQNVPATDISPAATAFYKKQAQQFWPKFNPYMKGMLALALYRNADKETPKTIIESLRETAQQKEELGMYWMDRGRSWWWWEAPIEAQSLLIECFAEVAKDNDAVDKMKRWLLKQKQTQSWPTTKATADACYALLLQGSQWLNADPAVAIQLGDKTIRSQDMKSEAGSGYFKVQYPGAEINPDMGNITLAVSNKSTNQQVNEPTNQPSWGAVYWQYFENLDKISSAATPLVVKKQLFIEKNTDRGPVLESISANASLKIGDKVKARIEIIVDRDMEYVHLKDGRASCFEPVNVLSGYRWQGGLGYYESTRDASSNFFFSYLPKGKYVFEYPMFVTSAGDFSNGIATIQCMYAPEFSAHSEGLRVRVK